MTFRIKSHSRNECDIYLCIIRERLATRLKQPKYTMLEILHTIIATYFHLLLIDHLWQQNNLTHSQQIIDQPMRTDLVRQRVICQNNSRISQTGLQPLNNRQRQFLQLLRSELSLCITNLPSQFRLKHGR